MTELQMARKHALDMASRSDTSSSDALLWLLIADEISDYLDPPDDQPLFGDKS